MSLIRLLVKEFSITFILLLFFPYPFLKFYFILFRNYVCHNISTLSPVGDHFRPFSPRCFACLFVCSLRLLCLLFFAVLGLLCFAYFTFVSLPCFACLFHLRSCLLCLPCLLCSLALFVLFALHCTALLCIALLYIALHCFALHCFALHCFA